ncbi:MAG: lactonase family protein [Clostridiaceae bacterium]|nr:lactonase family protein [Clostridiaceae bacterium]
MTNQTVCLSSCVPEGGVFRYELLPDGRLALQDHFAAAEPMYAIRRGPVIYLLLRAPFAGRAESGAQALQVQPDGSLTPLGELQPLGGTVACHLALSPNGRFLYTANYVSGNLTELPVLVDGSLGPRSRLVQHEGSSVNPRRQEGPHTHAAVFTPDGRFLCVVDLGLDQIILYAVDPQTGLGPDPAFICRAQPGQGPRHLVFSRDGSCAFCANELASSLTVYRYRDGTLEMLATQPTLPDGFTGENTCAAIRLSPDGRFVCVSNRGHDSIACFAIDGERVRLVSIAPSGGRSPRDFDFSPDGRYLLSSNEKEHTVTVLAVDPATGELALTGHEAPLASPLCVTW